MSVLRWIPPVMLILLASCSAPPLTLYSLNVPASRPDAPALGPHPVVIEIVRATVPDELDTQDIVVRSGSVLIRSNTGRWASRLSIGITDRLTGALSARRPDALVTDRSQADAPAYRLMVNINRLDVADTGTATIDADWLIVPHDAAIPTRRNRTRFTDTGPVTSNQDVVTLIGRLLDHIAGAIDVTGLR